MGSRANFVVVSGADWSLYHSQDAAQSMDQILATGPDAAIRFAQQQEPMDRQQGWLDDGWAEGGALIDVTRRRLVYFGGGEAEHGLEFRRVYSALLARTWPGWAVTRAAQGQRDLMAGAGLAPKPVANLIGIPEPDAFSTLEPAAEEDLADGIWTLVTVSDTHGSRGYSIDGWDFASLWWAGPGLVPALDDLGDGSAVITGRPPRSGLHCDLTAQTAGWWTTGTEWAASLLPARWPGWEVHSWGDDGYENQVRACGPDVRVPAVDLLAGLDDVELQLGHPAGVSDGLGEALAALRQEFS